MNKKLVGISCLVVFLFFWSFVACGEIEEHVGKSVGDPDASSYKLLVIYAGYYNPIFLEFFFNSSTAAQQAEKYMLHLYPELGLHFKLIEDK